MKYATLTAYLEELDPDEIVEIYEETPSNILRSFNCSPSALRRLIEDAFPDAVQDGDEDEAEESDDGEE